MSAFKQKNDILATRLEQHEHLVQMLRNDSYEDAIKMVLNLREGQDITSIIGQSIDARSVVRSAVEPSPNLQR